MTIGAPSADAFSLMLHEATRREVERLVAEEIEEATKRVADKMRAAADNIALSLLAHYDISQMREHIIITVKKEDF